MGNIVECMNHIILVSIFDTKTVLAVCIFYQLLLFDCVNQPHSIAGGIAYT